MKQRCVTLALVWCSFAVSGCAVGPWDINNETDRLAMIQEIKNTLTDNNCIAALSMAKPLYESIYSNNDIRMLYASSHACNIGISLYTLIDDITVSDFTSQDAIFKTLVRLFPSKAATDTRLQSAILAQDALHSVIPIGTVVGTVDEFLGSSNNPGSVLVRDRTADANIYLAFTSMALVGAGLNRHGFAAATDPISLGYGQEVALPWTSEALIKADTSHQGCAVASGLLNMLDGINELSAQAPGTVAAALAAIVTNLQVAVDTAAHFSCDATYGVSTCTDAIVRLRYRESCWETDAAAASAAGIIAMINLGWL